MSYNGMFVIFGIYRVDLHNRILISAWLDDLHFSASSTVRPKLWRLCEILRVGRARWKFTCNLPMGTHSNGVNTNSYGSHPGMGAHPTTNLNFFEQVALLVCLRESVSWASLKWCSGHSDCWMCCWKRIWRFVVRLKKTSMKATTLIKSKFQRNNQSDKIQTEETRSKVKWNERHRLKTNLLRILDVL